MIYPSIAIFPDRHRFLLFGAEPSSALSAPFPQRLHRTLPGYSVFDLLLWYLSSFRIRVWDVPSKYFSDLKEGSLKLKIASRYLLAVFAIVSLSVPKQSETTAFGYR